MAKLILVRHGKSEWNALGKWTGWSDVDLVQEGIDEAKKAGAVVCDIDIGCAHVSSLKRAESTLQHMSTTMNKKNFEVKVHNALKERNYGIHTGKNKWEVKEEIGEEEFQKIRRGWNTHIPEGETLKDVHDRVVPYYQENILKDLKEGKNVLVVSHGNTLRALIKHLESIDEEGISEVEVGTGEVHCYEIDENGAFLNKEIRSVNEDKVKV